MEKGENLAATRGASACTANPPAVVRGIAGLAWIQGRLDVALGILVGFHCMLRGCEVLRLRFCDCMHFGGTIVLDLGFTKTGSRKGTREQVTITDSLLTNLFRYFCRECSSSEHLVCMSPCNFHKYFSRLLSFFSLGSEGFTLHLLRRGGATHFFRVTGNLSATLERGRWLRLLRAFVYQRRDVDFGSSQNPTCHRCRGVAMLR